MNETKFWQLPRLNWHVSSPSCAPRLVTHLPSEKSILSIFSSPRGVAILGCESHSQAGSAMCDTTYIIHSMKSYLYSVEGKCILPWFNLYENVAMPCQPFPTIFKPDLVIWSQSSTLQCNVSWCHHCTMCTCFMSAHCQQFAMWCNFFHVSTTLCTLCTSNQPTANWIIMPIELRMNSI